MIKTIAWQDNAIKIIDQAALPQKLRYIYIRDLKTLWQAIKELRVRGAPALGAAAAFGVYVGIKNSKAKDFSSFRKELKKTVDYIASSRPTARNLFWALERVSRVALNNPDKPIAAIKRLILRQAQEIVEEDRRSCRRIGFYGARLIKSGDSVLTVCNAGILATIDYGTALGVIYRAKEEGKKIKVFACETRPLLQGARLTAWELKQKGIEVTLIGDAMAAALMRQGKINLAIAGADRIAANGDTANKIGTYGLAVSADYHRIPFYIAAPASTFDRNIKTGKEITIEQRNPGEITGLFFKKPVVPAGTKVYNPAFDVTAHNLISAIITDKGIIKPPYRRNIAGVLGKNVNKQVR